MSAEKTPLAELEEAIGYRFKDESLLAKAMTHSSLVSRGLRSYERLEFVGDAAIGLVVAQRFFQHPGRLSEGQMSEMKAAAVNRRSLAEAGRRIGLQRFIRVGKGLAESAQYPPSLIADAYEALVGAVFLDGGFSRARRVVLRTLRPELEAAEQRRHPPNYKSLLQQLMQAEGKGTPAYSTAREEGPRHNKRFLAVVRVDGVEHGSGWGKTKKQAEQQAAAQALERLYPHWRSMERPRSHRRGSDGQAQGGQ